MRHYLFFYLFTCTILFSCSVEKRHYRNGFYVDFHLSNNSQFISAKDEGSTVDSLPNYVEKVVVSTDPAVGTDTVAADSNSSSGAVETQVITCEQDGMTSQPRDEIPPDQDRPNKKLFRMMLTSVLLGACTVGVLFPPVSVVFFILPLLGLSLFIVALYYRRRVLRRLIAGEKGEEVQLSKFYPNFALALYLFFGAVAATFVGIVLIGSAIGIAGIILFEGGMIVGGAALLLLVLLSIIWLFKWRKQGEGRKKPWEPRPKDP